VTPSKEQDGQRRGAQDGEDFRRDRPAKEKSSEPCPARLPAARHDLRRARRQEERCGQIHERVPQLQAGGGKRAQRKKGKRASCFCPEAAREGRGRTKSGQAYGQMHKSHDAFASGEKGTSQERVVVAPQKGSRIEVWERQDACLFGKVANLWKMVGQGVPGKIWPQCGQKSREEDGGRVNRTRSAEILEARGASFDADMGDLSAKSTTPRAGASDTPREENLRSCVSAGKRTTV
jgi:hypothetical protein